MKTSILKLALSLLIFTGVSDALMTPGFSKFIGNRYDSYVVYVSSTGTRINGSTLFTSTHAIVSPDNCDNISVILDWNIYVDEDSAGDLFISSSNVTLPERNISGNAFIRPGKDKSPNGSSEANIYGKYQAGLTGWTTACIDVFGIEQK